MLPCAHLIYLHQISITQENQATLVVILHSMKPGSWRKFLRMAGKPLSAEDVVSGSDANCSRFACEEYILKHFDITEL